MDNSSDLFRTLLQSPTQAPAIDIGAVAGVSGVAVAVVVAVVVAGVLLCSCGQ